MKNTAKSDLILGFDTSNYTTSLALTARDETIRSDLRIPLRVNKGERGLRQSSALFQHLQNLPAMVAELMSEDGARERIGAVSVSSRPRPMEGSYMPVFLAGLRFAETVASCLDVPCFTVSHQEGHLAAAAHSTPLSGSPHYLAYHLSGGTCELLEINQGMGTLMGTSKDLSFGQVLDRIGVAMGLDFPAGAAMDKQALSWEEKENLGKKGQRTNLHRSSRDLPLKKISLNGLEINLSGLETQAQRLLSTGEVSHEELSFLVFYRIVEVLALWTQQGAADSGCSQVLFCGGVASSCFLRKNLIPLLESKGISAVFGTPRLSSDNGVGTALLGGRKLWR